MITIKSLDTIALNIATHIKTVVPDHPSSIDVLKHGISVAINTVSIILLTIGISFFTDRMQEALLAMVSFSMLRQIVGGIHLKSNIVCIVVSTVLLTALSFASFNYNWVVITSIISIVLILVYAPSRVEGKTRISKQHYPLLKFMGVAIVALNLWLAFPVVAASFFVQSLTLIEGGVKNEKNQTE
ncbi:accessory gene regulator B family protein [Paenibacillus sp. EKM102P]|uniref:accessory gene regulator ArgB-like protein n=1 Tax=unclassified Paenibacillus TaxID=185978 RepID=UPI00142D5823|nr:MULTISPECIES: accessory gene regulator B family protein [unclassified Paenibacillus]KAF6614361.1 accessory gene regulator B family protein [Paenibacillus sp. EKM101P]KAF6624576.1 accessory gene regulator B family protein [Paenibacillus sp. EKM102P]KAF6635645.1 accessory gene regulator B family protein [Paenibacillus sp. EKM10P]KAF6648645.1 accessory gene regulator B family protein [Paenibacillus sp. EKM11P]